MRPVRVLIIDASLTMRRLIRLALAGGPRLAGVGGVVGHGTSGR